VLRAGGERCKRSEQRLIEDLWNEPASTGSCCVVVVPRRVVEVVPSPFSSPGLDGVADQRGPHDREVDPVSRKLLKK
jgi:hypothetical protein